MNLPDGMPTHCACGAALGGSVSSLTRRASLYRRGRRTFRCRPCNMRRVFPRVRVHGTLTHEERVRGGRIGGAKTAASPRRFPIESRSDATRFTPETARDAAMIRWRRPNQAAAP